MYPCVHSLPIRIPVVVSCPVANPAAHLDPSVHLLNQSRGIGAAHHFAAAPIGDIWPLPRLFIYVGGPATMPAPAALDLARNVLQKRIHGLNNTAALLPDIVETLWHEGLMAHISS